MNRQNQGISLSSIHSDRRTPHTRNHASLPWRLLSAVVAWLALAAASTVQAVVFFQDDFERTTLDTSTGQLSGRVQNQLSSGADIYRTTRVWTAAAGGLEVQANGVNGFNANSGTHRVELDTNANSSMSTLISLVQGQSYRLRFQHRSVPRTTTVRQCTLFIFCRDVTTTVFVGGGLSARIEAPGYSTGALNVGDAGVWTEAIFTFTYSGPSGEARLTIAAAGTSDGVGTSLDDVKVETTIADGVGAEALTGILPPPVPGLLSADTNRSDIVTPIVVDKRAAIALGKALFWDQAVGSDQMACASCHFHSGADNRVKNQMSPGLNHAAASGRTFELLRSGNRSGPNATLTFADFPFDPLSDDAASSSGSFSGAFQSSTGGSNDDACARAVGNLFHVNSVGTRSVEPRNTPTVINAAYNFRNFWDGRANNEFNGVTPFGARDGGAGVFVNTAAGMVKRPMKLQNASLASQAVEPVGSELEMACRGRQFADVGRKLLNRKPLGLQTIAASDSVLSALPAMIGTNGTYANLIQRAFAAAYWNGNCGAACGTPAAGVSPAGAYNHMEANFSLYFGIALQMYQETLISDDTRFDRWKRGLGRQPPAKRQVKRYSSAGAIASNVTWARSPPPLRACKRTKT